MSIASLVTGLLGLVAVWIISATTAQTIYNLEIVKYGPQTQFDKSWLDLGTLRLAKVKKNTFILSGEVEFMKNFGDEQKLSWAVFQKSPVTGQYGKTPILTRTTPMCKFIAEDTMVYSDLVKSSDFPSPGTCPFPKKKYTVKNYTYDPEKLPKTMPFGEFKSVITFLNDVKPVAGLEVEAIISKT